MNPSLIDYLETAINIYSSPDNDIWEVKMYLNSLVANNKITAIQAKRIFGTVVDTIDN